jgi:polyhydroxyalkanoate synthase
VPLIAPVRPFLGVGGDRAAPIALAYRLMGGMPEPVVRRAFQVSSLDKLVTKPFVQLAKLDDTEFLAQVEAVDRFTRSMTAYPGRSFGQLYHRMIRGNELATGVVDADGVKVRFADVAVPVLAFGGAGDTIAPVSSVRPVVDLLTGAPEVRFEIVPGGHLGMLTGRAARTTTWRILDEWLDRHSGGKARDGRTPSGSRPAAKRPAASPRPRAGRSKQRRAEG